MAGETDKIIMILVTFFLGYLGIHRFIKGYWLSGIVWLCTGGLFGIGWIIDLIWVILDKALIWPK
ncbi:MAG TPA: TM2 domain-containing protein [candidate division Zixibacteria bacterium]|nr:TM2 domain-containing protein [candidate division Zixibacteria bacterium]